MSDKTNGEEDNDELFLDQVLNTLYDFGDKQTKKKSKKKKRKRCEEEEHVAAEDGRTESLGVQFHLDNTNTHHANREQTGPSLQQRAHVEVVTFQDPTKRPRAPQRAAPELQKPSRMTEKKKTEDAERLNLEKARLEVHRFGITGYKKEQQRVFEQERAVMLGARAPKKLYVNYKLLQEQLKDKKQKAKVVAQEQKKKTKKPNNKIRDEKKRSSSGPGSAPSGQVGRFKNGMLRLSSKDVKGIKLRISKD